MLSNTQRRCFRESRKLKVGNLPDEVDVKVLRKEFERHGRVLDVRLEEEDEMRFAIVSFMDLRTAVRAHSERNAIGDQLLVTGYFLPGVPMHGDFTKALAAAKERGSMEPSEGAAQVPNAGAWNKTATPVSSPLPQVISSCSPSSADTCVELSRRASLRSLPTGSPTRDPAELCVVNERSLTTAALVVSNLPVNASELCVRERVYYKFRRYGCVCAVKIRNSNGKRTGIVRFTRPEDALGTYRDLSGQILLWDGMFPFQPSAEIVSADSDMACEDNIVYTTRATRTLYAGNLPSCITATEVRSLFESFGDIWMLDMKQTANGSPYVFIYFDHIRCVARAMKVMNGKMYRGHTLKLGFGRCQTARALWLGGIPKAAGTSDIAAFIGVPESLVVHEPHLREAVIIMPDSLNASAALNNCRSRKLMDQNVEIDFAPRDFLNSTLFCEIVLKRFPFLELDGFDVNQRKRVLRDLSGGPESLSPSPLERPQQLRPAMSSPDLPVRKESAQDTPSPVGSTPNAVGDVDMRFLPDDCSKDSSEEISPLLPSKRRSNSQAAHVNALRSRRHRDESIDSEARTILECLVVRIGNTIPPSVVKDLALMKLLQETRGLNSHLMLAVGCLNCKEHCKCGCFWFLYGNRLMGHFALNKIFLSSQIVWKRDNRAARGDNEQWINEVLKNPNYCVAMFDSKLCCYQPFGLSAFSLIQIGEGLTARVCVLDHRVECVRPLKRLSALRLSSYQDYSLVLIY